MYWTPERISSIKLGSILVFKSLEEIKEGNESGNNCTDWNYRMNFLAIERKIIVVDEHVLNAIQSRHPTIYEYRTEFRTWYISLNMLELSQQKNEDGKIQCRYCMDLCEEEDMFEVAYGLVCKKCILEYIECAECGKKIHKKTEVFVEENELLCHVCFGTLGIQEYSYKPDPIFLGETEDNLYLGVELEVDKGQEKDKCIRKVHRLSKDVYCKYDCSLDNGFEIVSHPATLGYHLNRLKWNDIIEKCKEYGFKGHDTSTCGTHIHVSRSFFGTGETQDLNIAKTILLVNKFWDSHIVSFSRRGSSSLERWAKKSDLKREKDDTNSNVIKKMKDESDRWGRYVAVNLQNENTIEFRFFRGTLNIKTFFAILQFVDTICRFAKSVSLDSIDITTWNDIFGNTEYQELKEYNESKGLN